MLRDELDVAKSSRRLATVPKQLKSTGLKRLVERAFWAEGIRKPLEKGEKRHAFKADHGFRKYFKTMTEQQMKSLHVEILMGHSTGLADNYYRISEDELLSEYLKAIPSLSVYESSVTISDETIKSFQKEIILNSYLYIIKKTMDYNKFCSEILNLSPKIRFAGVYSTVRGNVYFKMQKGIKKIFSDEQTKDSLVQAYMRWKSRLHASDLIGKPIFTMTKYPKINRVTLPCGENGILMISSEPDLEPSEIIDGVCKLREKYADTEDQESAPQRLTF